MPRGFSARQLVIMHKGTSSGARRPASPGPARYGHANEHIMRIELQLARVCARMRVCAGDECSAMPVES